MIPVSSRVQGHSLGRAIVRSWHWILVGALLGAVVAFVAIRAGHDDRPEVKALVVAEELVVGVDELAASVGAVYRAGGVGERAVAEASLDIDADELTGDRVDVEVVASTPVVQVVGRDDDPERAAVFANATATSLAAALTEARGIGVFSVIEQADAMAAESPADPPVAQFAAIGALLGALVGFALRLVTRSPVYSLTEVAEVSRAPLMDEVTLSGTNVRTLGSYLLSTHRGWRLLHCGSGDDHTEQLSELFEEAIPGARIARAESSLVASPAWMDGTEKMIVVVAEGADARAVRASERIAGPRLGATLFVRRPRRGDDDG